MSKAQKYNNGKLSFSSLDPTALALLAKVLDYGRIKYDQFNYMAGGLSLADFHDAYMRHYLARSVGQLHDDETRLLHVAHMCACAFMALANEAAGNYSPLAQKFLLPELKLDAKIVERMAELHAQNFKKGNSE